MESSGGSPNKRMKSIQAPPIMLILVGLPGAGKSTFASSLIRRSTSQRWARINQDTVKGGARGTRDQCITATRNALRTGCHVIIDRTNLSPQQRNYFIDVARASSSNGVNEVHLHCVYFNLSEKACGERAAQRKAHEGGVQGQSAYEIVAAMQTDFGSEPPPSAANEGFASVLECSSDADIDAALDLWVQYMENSVGAIVGDDEGKKEDFLNGEWEKRKRSSRSGSKDGMRRIDTFFDKSESGRGAVVTTAFQPPQERQQLDNTRNDGNNNNNNAFSLMMSASKQQHQQQPPPTKKSSASSSGQKGNAVVVQTRQHFGNAPLLLQLSRYLINPETQADVLFYDSQCVAVRDAYPKAQFHCLVLARDYRLQGPLDLTGGDRALVQHMKEIGLRVAGEYASPAAIQCGFNLGFHSIPSMRHLHLHVISRDFNSVCLKKKKHWNSFTTAFWLDVDWVLQQLDSKQRATEYLDYSIDEKEALEKGNMKCPKCGAALSNIPAVKEHVQVCTSRC